MIHLIILKILVIQYVINTDRSTDRMIEAALQLNDGSNTSFGSAD